MQDTQRSAAPCPVCDAECSGKPEFRYTAERAALHFCPPWRDSGRHERLLHVIRRMWPNGVVQVRHCDQCGFSFGDPFRGGDDAFYRILHEQMGYPAWRWDYDAALAQPSVRALQGGRVLDVGAGAGAFLSRLGEDWDTHAVESTEITRAVLEGKGIKIHESLDAPTLNALAGSFDLITLFQVLEHISDFYPVLRACRMLLKPGGVIVITVPDGDAMAEQERMTGCPDMPPNHIGRWSPNSLSLALRKSGLSPQHAVPEPPSWSKVRQHLYLKVIADAARPWSLAAQVYRVKRKAIRAPLLGAAGVLGGVGLLRYGTRLRRGGAFALAAVRDS